VTQVEGYVLAEHVRLGEQSLIDLPESGSVDIYAEPTAEAERLVRVTQPAPVLLLEQLGEWLKIQVTVAGYVSADQVAPPAKRNFSLPCSFKPLSLSLLGSVLLKDAPSLEGAHNLASLKTSTPMTVLEDETGALEKINRKVGWLLAQTSVSGYVQAGNVDDNGQPVIRVTDGDCVDVFEAPDAGSQSLICLTHPVQAVVLENSSEWLKVSVMATGYIEAKKTKPVGNGRMSCRKGRPKIENQPDSTQERPSDQQESDERENDERKKDNLQLIEGIGPTVEDLLNAAGIFTFKQLAETETRIEHVKALLTQAGYPYMYPYTWPEQARLAAAGDWQAFQKLKDELVRGRPADIADSDPI
jgi:predicted flap endonuclease-1-like 5' DNA nuclease